jgi:hypothetical protein
VSLDEKGFPPVRAYCSGEGEVASQLLKFYILIFFLIFFIFNPSNVVELDELCMGENPLSVTRHVFDLKCYVLYIA